MILKEKFDKVQYNEYGIDTEICQKIADDYAIEFAEWLLYKDITQRGKSNFVCADGVQRSTKELLEMFKNNNII